MLRGVNLGGRKVIMSELRELCEAAGFTDVKTLLASGNLVVNAKLSGAKLEAKLEKVIVDGLKMKSDVFVRDLAQLEAIIAANPFKAFTKATALWSRPPGLPRRSSTRPFSGRCMAMSRIDFRKSVKVSSLKPVRRM